MTTEKFTYQSVCDDLVKAEHITPEEVWSPDQGEDQFEINYTKGFFLYTQEALEKEYPDFKISPARFCYINDDALNAEACFHENFYSILINIGAIRNLKDLFDEELIYSKGLLFLENSMKEYGMGLDLFLQQMGLLFIMEHERAHLAQFSRQNEIWRLEYGESDAFLFSNKGERMMRDEQESFEEFKLSDHLLEMDADLNGVSYVGSFILQQLRNKFSEVPYELFHDLFSAALASLMVLFLHWFREHELIPLYFKERKHPHPMIRTAYCWEHFLQILAMNKKVIGFDVDIVRIREASYDIQNAILDMNGYKGFEPIDIQKNAASINEYLNFLSDNLETEPATFQYKYRKSSGN